jgi:hypothetical protein
MSVRLSVVEKSVDICPSTFRAHHPKRGIIVLFHAFVLMQAIQRYVCNVQLNTRIDFYSAKVIVSTAQVNKLAALIRSDLSR